MMLDLIVVLGFCTIAASVIVWAGSGRNLIVCVVIATLLGVLPVALAAKVTAAMGIHTEPWMGPVFAFASVAVVAAYLRYVWLRLSEAVGPLTQARVFAAVVQARRAYRQRVRRQVMAYKVEVN